MGVHFSLIFLLLKASALWHLQTLHLLPLVLMLSRYNITVALRYFEYAREEGMATLAKKELTSKQFFFSTLGVISIALLYPQGAILLSISLLYLWLISTWLIKKFGALHGDGYGFIIETTELLLLHVILLGSSL
jgi:cobalamin synthase